MRLLNLLSGIEGLITGGTITINVPVGCRYHAIHFNPTINGAAAAATAFFDWIQLQVDGVTVRNLSPAQMLAIARVNGLVPPAGDVASYFSEPWRATVTGEELTSWDMNGNGVRKFVIQAKITAGITDPLGLTVEATFDYGQNVDPITGKRALSIVHQDAQTYNLPAGRYDINDIPTDFPINRIHLFAPSSDLTQVEVYRDSQKVFEGYVFNVTQIYSDYGISFAGDGTHGFPILFDFTQQISDYLTVKNDFYVRVWSAGAQAVTAVTERICPAYL